MLLCTLTAARHYQHDPVITMEPVRLAFTSFVSVESFVIFRTLVDRMVQLERHMWCPGSRLTEFNI